MSEKRFTLDDEENGVCRCILVDGEEMPTCEICDLLNELVGENEQLRKQIQNYKQLIFNSYVGEEETLDGFVGKYVIWEDELQKYKNKNEMIGDE